jgi:hypothetical protein
MSTRVTRASCLRPNARSWRVSDAPRSVAPRISAIAPLVDPSVTARLQEDVGVPHGDLQQVVEVVRDAGRDLADGFHLLRAAQRPFRLAHVGERGPQLGLARTQRPDERLAARDQLAAHDRDGVKMRSDGRSTVGGARRVDREAATAIAVARRPAPALPQCADSATAPKTGANGATAKKGHVSRVRPRSPRWP